jgi:hypothetical protein
VNNILAQEHLASESRDPEIAPHGVFPCGGDEVLTTANLATRKIAPHGVFPCGGDEVLTTLLGYSSQEISVLREQGVVL